MAKRNPNHGFDVVYDDWSQEHDQWFDDEDEAVGFGRDLADDPVNPSQHRYASVTVWLDSLDGSRDRKRLFHVDRC